MENSRAFKEVEDGWECIQDGIEVQNSITGEVIRVIGIGDTIYTRKEYSLDLIKENFPNLSPKDLNITHKLQEFVNYEDAALLYRPYAIVEEDTRLATKEDFSEGLGIPLKDVNSKLFGLRIRGEALVVTLEGRGVSAYIINPKYQEMLYPCHERQKDWEYVYRFIGNDDRVLYVGRTDNLRRRLHNEHFTKRGHLPKSCYEETAYIETSYVNNKNESVIYEMFYISKDRPVYNVRNNKDSHSVDFNINIPPLNWHRIEKDKTSEIEGAFKESRDIFRTLFKVMA